MDFFTEEQIGIIEKDFLEIQKFASGRAEELFGVFSRCTYIEKICLKFLYVNIPISDLANYDGELFLKHIRHCLKVKDILPWGKEIDWESFINFILPLRVNNENLEFFGEILFDELYPRIKNMGMYNAILEVNFWCLEKATYTPTDIRTVSPLTMLRNSLGRCGEESTFTVAAMRSVCIPARQCYAPRWSHNDDNHAWVEVYIDNKWHYLGACEPEPVLDRGWFTVPASRSMLTHSRVFSKFISSGDIIYKSPKITELNSLATYAGTKRISVFVYDGKKPVAGASVRFEIVNYSELFPLATLITDDKGSVSIMTGYGDLFIHVSKDGKFCYSKIDVRESDTLHIDLSNAVSEMSGLMEFDIIPPDGITLPEFKLSPEDSAAFSSRIQKAHAVRRSYQETFFNEDSAKAYASKYEGYATIIAEALTESRGNHKEIEAFLENGFGLDIKWKASILGTLNKKDYGDITAEILASFVRSSMKYMEEYDEDVFVKYILCPRVYFEMIVPCRENLLKILGPGQIDSFRDDPSAVAAYVHKNIEEHNDLDYNVLYAAADKLLMMGKGSKQSKKILMVSICRAVGIPARIDPSLMSVEYYKDGIWYLMEGSPVEESKNSELKLIKTSNDSKFTYMSSYSIAKLIDGIYVTLDIEDTAWSGDTCTYRLSPGYYRLLTANRLSSGTILANAYHFELKDNSSAILQIDLRQPSSSAGNETAGRVGDMDLYCSNGKKTSLSHEFTGDKSIFAWLEAGKEPTEHLLNEILEHSAEYNDRSCNLILVVSDRMLMNDPTVLKVKKSIKGTKLFFNGSIGFDDSAFSEAGIKNKLLPYAAVVDSGLNVYYSTTGYNIGSASMLLKYI